MCGHTVAMHFANLKLQKRITREKQTSCRPFCNESYWCIRLQKKVDAIENIDWILLMEVRFEDAIQSTSLCIYSALGMPDTKPFRIRTSEFGAYGLTLAVELFRRMCIKLVESGLIWSILQYTARNSSFVYSNSRIGVSSACTKSLAGVSGYQNTFSASTPSSIHQLLFFSRCNGILIKLLMHAKVLDRVQNEATGRPQATK